MILTVAAAQAEAVAGDLVANVATAAGLVRAAADRGAQLVVLPEAFLTGYDLAVFAGPLPSLVDLPLDPLREAARETGAVVVASSALAAGGVATLSSVVVQPDGAVDVPYDKQHLDGDEAAYFTPGDHGASIRVHGLELGLSICYDGCFPEHARAAAEDGAVAYLTARRTSSAASTAATSTTPPAPSRTACTSSLPASPVAAGPASSAAAPRCTTPKADR